MKIKITILITLIYLFPIFSFADNTQIFTNAYVNSADKRLPLMLVRKADNNWVYRPVQNLPDGIFKMQGWGMSSACSETLCVATSNMTSSSFSFMAVSYDQGNLWSYTSNFGQKDASRSSLYGVDCNDNLCVAVGSFRKKNKNNDPLFMPFISINYGKGWEAVNSIVKNLPSDFESGQLDRVTCHNSFCIASGWYTSLNDPNDGSTKSGYPLVAVSHDQNKLEWTYSPSIKTNIPSGVRLEQLYSVNCTDKVCILSGASFLPHDFATSIASIATSYDQGKTWNYPTDVSSKLPKADDANDNSYFADAKCFNDLCIAVGEMHKKAGTSYPLIAVSHDIGKTWSYVNHFDSNFTGYNPLGTISCNEKICLSGTGGSPFTMNPTPFLMYSKDQGETWSTLNEFPKNYNGRDGVFTKVSCNNTTCFAIGDYISTDKKVLTMLASTQDGNTWSYLSSVLPEDFKDIYNYGLLSIRNKQAQ